MIFNLSESPMLQLDEIQSWALPHNNLDSWVSAIRDLIGKGVRGELIFLEQPD